MIVISWTASYSKANANNNNLIYVILLNEFYVLLKGKVVCTGCDFLSRKCFLYSGILAFEHDLGHSVFWRIKIISQITKIVAMSGIKWNNIALYRRRCRVEPESNFFESAFHLRFAPSIEFWRFSRGLSRSRISKFVEIFFKKHFDKNWNCDDIFLNYILQKYLHYSIQIIIRMMKNGRFSQIRLLESGSESSFKNEWTNKISKNFWPRKKLFGCDNDWLPLERRFEQKRLERSDWGMHRRRSIMRFWIHLRKFTKRVWTWELIEEPLFCCFLFVVGCQHRCRSINKKQISLFGLTFDLCKSVVWVSRFCVSSL